MNPFDIIIIAIVVISILIGLLNGFTKEIFSLLSIFLGIIIASRYYQKFAFIFKIENEILAQAISFVIIFLVVCLFVSLIGIFFCKIWRILHLTLFDRMLGAFFGLFRGIIIITLIAILIEKFPIAPIKNLTEGSFFFPLLSPLKEILLSIFPFSFFER